MSKNGFSPVIIILAIASLALVPLLVSQVSSEFSRPKAGIMVLAKDGSGENEGSSGSSGSSGGTSGSSDSSGESSGSTNQTLTVRTENSESPEIRTEQNSQDNNNDDENEVENEIEKPEIELVEIRSSESGELEVETKVGTGSADRRNRRGQTAQFTLHFNNGQNEIEIKAHGQEIEFQSQGIGAFTNFPLSFDKTTNTLTVNTPNGPRIIRVLPDQASEIAQNSGVQNLIERIDLVESATGGAEPIVFKVTGTRNGNFLGLFPVAADVETQIGAQSGQILATNEPFWLRLFGALIR